MILWSLLVLIAVFLVLTAAITRGFGPYKGRVMDLETGAPLEGAAVLISFHSKRIDTTLYAGAVETLTDKNGEFRFSRKRLFVFHILSKWRPHGYVKIFKPGYGCYPNHIKAEPRFAVGGTLPQNYYATIKLPKLETIEERRRNLYGLEPGGKVPDRKMRNLLRLESQERVNIGLKPLPAWRYGD